MSNPARDKREMQIISILAATLALSAGMAAQALGQIVTPSLFPPTCSDSHCVNQNQGATLIPQGATQVQRGCPQGTMFDALKGTCKVLPQAPGTP